MHASPVLVVAFCTAVAAVVWAVCGRTRRRRKTIDNRHVVVTGGSSGIGLELAKLAARAGAHVTIVARDPKKLEAAKAEVQQHCKYEKYQRVKAVSVDVGDWKRVRDVSQEIMDMGPIHMLVNCAGVAVCGTLETISEADTTRMVNTNLLGTINCLRAFLPDMKLTGDGVVLIVSSQAALIGIYGMSVYSSTKFALRGLAEALLMEVRQHGITVTLALPPDTDTPGFAEENKSKPIETDLISQSAGLFKPQEVAESILRDALNGAFFSYIGLESFMVTTLCCGMSHFSSLSQLFLQSVLMGPLRLVGAYYISTFNAIIKKCKTDAKAS